MSSKAPALDALVNEALAPQRSVAELIHIYRREMSEELAARNLHDEGDPGCLDPAEVWTAQEFMRVIAAAEKWTQQEELNKQIQQRLIELTRAGYIPIDERAPEAERVGSTS